MHWFDMVLPATSMACKIGILAVRSMLMVWANWLALDMRTTLPIMGTPSWAFARAGPPFSVVP